MQPLIGKTVAELQELVKQLGLPGFTAGQMADWIYKKGVVEIDQMTNLSLKTRQLLAQQYEVGRTSPVNHITSTDETEKYLFETAQGHLIETVYIPDKERATLCVSSQVGCKMNCRFCHTGKMGFDAQLTVAEIVNQIYSNPHFEQLTNIVFMGMGEPFDNTDALLKATQIITAPWGMAWSPKRITVSTVGIEKGLKRFLDETQCHLAISLHNPFSQQRAEMMPVEKTFPIEKIIALLKQYDFSHQRRLSFEYILFKQWNDTPEHAQKLIALLKGIDARVNLIRFHESPYTNLKSSDDETMLQFRNQLNAARIIATIRSSRGEDILAACGMLSTKEKMQKINNTTQEESNL